MARPFRLRYTDNNGNEQLIGRYLGDADTDSSIQQGMLKNNGSGEATRLEIKGDKNILDRMPVDKNMFQENFPEIVMDVYSQNQADWIERDRVFAEHPGTIESDDGDYRNDQLAGFEKYVGKEKTNNKIGPINTNLADVLTALLNESSISHEVQTLGTIPSVNNYSFSGNIGSALRDIHRDYPSVKIFWTGKTNSNGDLIVKLEEKGAGPTVETLSYPADGYELIEYEPEDTSIVVNRATIRGTDGDGNIIEVDTDNFTSGQLATDIQNSKDKYGERSLPPRNIGYLESEAHAQEIAKNQLQLEAQPHLKIAIPFQEQNVLNNSVGIIDDRYDINDTFTVVKQRDFYKDSKTEVELSFEKNRTEKKRGERRDLGEERARLYPSQDDTIDINFGDFNAENDTAEADIDTDEDNENPNVSGDTGNPVGTNDYEFSQGVRSNSPDPVPIQGTVPSFGEPVDFFMVHLHVSFLSINGSNSSQFDVEIDNTTTGDNLFNVQYDVFQDANGGDGDWGTISFTIIEDQASGGDTIEATLENDDNDAWDAKLTLTIDAVEEHTHDVTGNTDFHDHNVTTEDFGHGGSGDASEHVITGQQIQKLLQLLEEVETDR